MPRYRTESGVVVNIPEELAARMGLVLTVSPAPPATKRPYRRKSKSSSES